MIRGRFYGPTRLRDALARSRNLITIRLMRQMGIPYTRDYVQRFGLPAEHIPADLTAALGTAQLTPLEMAGGFAVFANGGSRVSPYLVERVYAADGSVLKQAEPRSPASIARCPNPEGGGAAVTHRRGAAGAARDLGGERLDHDRPDARSDQERHRPARPRARAQRHRRQDRHDQ